MKISVAFLVFCNLLIQIHVCDADTLNACDKWNTCSQGCEKTVDSFTCTCIDGFVLGQDNRTCEPKESNVQIVFALKYSIRVWSSKDKTQKIISENGQCVGVAVDVQNQNVFWTEVSDNNEAIYRSKLDGGERIALIDTGLVLPEGISFDWITGNIYFTDSLQYHIVVCNGDGRFCSVLIKNYIDKKNKPRDIALEPNQGFMFWTYWGENASIVRAGMDGSSPISIITTGLKWPNGLAVDHGKSRLYWIDAGLNLIETCSFNGQNRRLILLLDKNDHPFSLDVFADTLYWSDWRSNSIQSCNKLSGENHTELLRETMAGDPHGLAIYHPAAQPKSTLNPCASIRCSHICVLTLQNSSACICPAGLILDQNNLTCIDDVTKPKLIFGQDNRLRTVNMASIGRNVVVEEVVSELRSIGAVIYNPINDTVIVSDTALKKIYEYNQRTKLLSVLAQGHIESVHGMSFDVVGKNLYWVDTNLRRVEVMSTRTGARAVLSQESQHPHDILVVPEERYMFLAMSDKNLGTIVRMYMDGSKRKTLYEIPEGKPVSLTYEPSLRRIFWCDILNNTIGQINVNGNVQSIVVLEEKHPYSIVSYANKLFWTNRHTQLLNEKVLFGASETNPPMFIGHSEVKRNKTLESHDFLAKIALMDKNISRYSTLIEEHDCGNEQHQKCSHICLISDFENVGTCVCPEGMIIGPNGKVCVQNKTCPPDEFQCIDNKCIDEFEICDGFSDCRSGEDEVNCTTWSGEDEVNCTASTTPIPLDLERKDPSCGIVPVIIILIVIQLTLTLVLIIGFVLKKKKRKLHPRKFVRPYVPLPPVVKYENLPTKSYVEPDSEKLTEEIVCDDLSEGGTFSKRSFANPIYEDIGGQTTIKMA